MLDDKGSTSRLAQSSTKAEREKDLVGDHQQSFVINHRVALQISLDVHCTVAEADGSHPSLVARGFFAAKASPSWMRCRILPLARINSFCSESTATLGQKEEPGCG